MTFDTTIKEYLKQIDHAPLLSWNDEKSLAEAVIEHNDPEARDRLVRSNLRLVVNIAKKFSGRQMSLGDLIEEGNLGLLRAVDTFDPEHGVRFSTYASWWIKQSIKRAVLANSQPIHVPTYMVELINQWRHTMTELEPRLGRPATLEEVAGVLKLPARKAKAIQQIVAIVQAGFQGDSDQDNSGINETVHDSKIISPEDAIGTDEELARAVELLEEIDQRQAEVLTMRFGLNGHKELTLKEIGEKLDLTRERVRQIQRSALARLNELMST